MDAPCLEGLQGREAGRCVREAGAFVAEDACEGCGDGLGKPCPCLADIGVAGFEERAVEDGQLKALRGLRGSVRGHPWRGREGERLDVAGDPAEGVEGGCERLDADMGREPARGTQAGEAAQGGGDAEGAAGVRAEADVGGAAEDGRGRAAAGASGEAGGVAGEGAVAPPWVLAGEPVGVLVEVGLADDPCAGASPQRDEVGVVGGDGEVLARGAGAGGGGPALSVDEVLDGHGEAREGRGAELGGAPCGLREGLGRVGCPCAGGMEGARGGVDLAQASGMGERGVERHGVRGAWGVPDDCRGSWNAPCLRASAWVHGARGAHRRRTWNA